MIRTEIGRDGRFRPMPAAGPFMADSDLAAVIGFLRSDDPLFAPVAERAPVSELTLAGEAIFVWMLTIPADAPVKIDHPAHAPTVELGRYVAMLGECWQCHTEGFDKAKLDEPGLFGGGFELQDHQGRTVYSSNITPDPTGMGGRGWSLDQFVTVMRDGVTPDGRVLRMPMPRFRYADDVELEALWKYLASVPKVSRANKEGTAPVQHASDSKDPALPCFKLGVKFDDRKILRQFRRVGRPGVYFRVPTLRPSLVATRLATSQDLQHRLTVPGPPPAFTPTTTSARLSPLRSSSPLRRPP